MTAAQVDVAILGGGPAGLAAAIALCRAGRTAVVFERAGYDNPRAGETFGGEIRPVLEQLGAWDAFAALTRVPFRGVRSAWGSDELSERPAIVKPMGEGVHVERARFDALLARCAAEAGAVVHDSAGLCAVTREEGGFRVEAPGRPSARARFLLDASGRGAPASATAVPERRWVSLDRLVGVVARMPGTGLVEPELLLEAAEEGWWYAVPQPDGALLVALLTDADLGVTAGARAGLGARFAAALARTVHVAALAGNAAPLEPVRIVRADSGFLSPDRGERFRAVGDAAFACDPLGGDGVLRALRSGLEAARDLAAALEGGAPGEAALGNGGTGNVGTGNVGTGNVGTGNVGTGNGASGELRMGERERQTARFESYLDTRAAYYSTEGRWPDALFWLRRRAAGLAAAPIVLDPMRTLSWNGAPPDARALGPVEALLPRSAIAAVLDELRTPRPAHHALSTLRARAPLSNRRLLVALQLLLANGCLAG